MVASRYRFYNVSYLLLLVNLTVGILAWSHDSSVNYALLFDPESVTAGQVWRLVTYALLPGHASFWTLLFKFFLYAFFAAAVERVLGSPRFLLLYFAAVLGGSLTAWLRGQLFLAGGIPEMVFFLVYGLMFPEQYVLIWFAFPIRVKPLALLYSVAYVFNAVQPNDRGYRFGVPALGGFLCGCGCFFLITRSMRWMRQMRRRPVDLATRRAMQADAALAPMTTAMLEDRVRRIVEDRRDSDGITLGERAIVQELIQRVDPEKELCHPNQEDGMCPICEELGVCLRRFLERRKDITSKGGR